MAGPLEGVSMGIKDNFCTRTLSTTCSSTMLQNFISPYDATVVDQLQKAGALVLGKTNMDEFGMGSATMYSHHGPVQHPYTCQGKVVEEDQKRVAGGSSGGSAAAVAMDMCTVALGSDTGGSVRLPASYCGVVGFKPSYGRCSRYGLVAYANSLDTVGILARTVADTTRVYDVISHHDSKDSTSMPVDLRTRVDEHDMHLASRWKGGDLTGLVVGIPQEYYVDPLSEDVLAIWRRGIRCLQSKGATIMSVTLPHTPLALPAYYTIALAEASSNLARYDGIRFGHQSRVAPTDPSMLYADTRTEGFGAEVQKRILLGTHVLISGTYDTLFLPAQKARRRIQEDFDRVFCQPNVLQDTPTKTEGQAHILLTPSAISSAPKMSDYDRQSKVAGTKAVDAYVNDVMTVPASLSGLPAITVPFGTSAVDGYPIGLQLMAQYGYDQLLLSIAAQMTESS
ncbi:amidase signature domain-containing protein [Spinellus fusiger]|nr:amidase signature domain-containing protein [Spinellus fusiger]